MNNGRCHCPACGEIEKEKEMKWNARATVSATFDFEVEAETEHQAKTRVREYLAFVQGGNPEGQKLSVETQDGDTCTGIFLDIDEIADVYDI